MPELEPQPTQSAAPGATAGQQAHDDRIARLHHMSTTAGIATQDYVAINNLAIASAIVGFSTILALLGRPFLILGAIGVIFGMVALRQIRHSNGTQGGRGIAILGILLSVGISAAVLGLEWREAQRIRREEQRVNDAIIALGAEIKAANYQRAYNLMAPEFRARISYPTFEQTWQNLASGDLYGNLVQFEGNEIVTFSNMEGFEIATTMTKARWEKMPEPARVTTFLKREEDGGWRIYRFDRIFDSALRQPASGNFGMPPGPS